MIGRFALETKTRSVMPLSRFPPATRQWPYVDQCLTLQTILLTYRRQWAGFAFLFFYLNAKLKVFSNHHAAMWKIIALYAPILAATLISGAVTIDEYHNWYDAAAGAIIGAVMAISAYRMVYASVWDFRFNHIPLTRHTPFGYGGGAPGAGGFESAVWTHQAGRGYKEALGGAPFDAAHGLRGTFGDATGLGSNANGAAHHDHGHRTQGGELLGAGQKLHDHHHDNVTTHNRSPGGGISSRNGHGDDLGHTATALEKTISHPHKPADADSTCYSNDMREPPRDPGLMRSGHSPAPTHGNHSHSHSHNACCGAPEIQGSIERKPVPPAKDGRTRDGIV